MFNRKGLRNAKYKEVNFYNNIGVIWIVKYIVKQKNHRLVEISAKVEGALFDRGIYAILQTYRIDETFDKMHRYVRRVKCELSASKVCVCVYKMHVGCRPMHCDYYVYVLFC